MRHQSDNRAGAAGERPRTGRGHEPYAVQLHIEALVLHGFAASDHQHLGEVVESVLTQLLTEHRMPMTALQSFDPTCLNGVTCTLTPEAQTEAIGSALAHALYRGLTAEARGTTPHA